MTVDGKRTLESELLRLKNKDRQRIVSDIPIEERPNDEITGYRDYQWAADGVSVRNPAFDVTPADLVTGLITEKGIILRPTTEKINRLFNSN